MLGLGLGGFIDGIVLHQILGWHHLICTTATCQVTSVESLQRQVTQDGYFHLATWLLTVMGVAMLARAAPAAASRGRGMSLVGAMLGGWGAFNLIEGLIDHQLLGIHHVLPGHPHQLLADMLFLASGLVLVLVGWRLVRHAQDASRRDGGVGLSDGSSGSKLGRI